MLELNVFYEDPGDFEHDPDIRSIITKFVPGAEEVAAGSNTRTGERHLQFHLKISSPDQLIDWLRGHGYRTTMASYRGDPDA